MEHEPDLKEDAKNLSVVAGSAIFATLVTLGLLVNQAVRAPERIVVHEIQPVVVDVQSEGIIEKPEAPVAPLSGSNRIWRASRAHR